MSRVAPRPSVPPRDHHPHRDERDRPWEPYRAPVDRPETRRDTAAPDDFSPDPRQSMSHRRFKNAGLPEDDRDRSAANEGYAEEDYGDEGYTDEGYGENYAPTDGAEYRLADELEDELDDRPSRWQASPRQDFPRVPARSRPARRRSQPPAASGSTRGGRKSGGTKPLERPAARASRPGRPPRVFGAGRRPGRSPRNLRWRKGLKLPGGSLLWAGGGALTVAALDWKLALAALAGGAVAWGAYRLRSHDWRTIDGWFHRWTQNLGRGENGKLAIAVGGGSAAMLAVYLTSSLLSESGGGWLAGATVLQGLGTLAAIALLARQWLVQPVAEDERRFEQALADLGAADDLKQMSAARTLAWLAERGRLDRLQQVAAADCLRLLLGRSLVDPAREAALDALAQLEPACAPTVGHLRPVPVRLQPKRALAPPADE